MKTARAASSPAPSEKSDAEQQLEALRKHNDKTVDDLGCSRKDLERAREEVARLATQLEKLREEKAEAGNGKKKRNK